jgi:hypothetical protein
MQPYPLEYEPAVPLPQMVLRSRREVSTRDAVNARQFEHWQTDAPYMNLNRPDVNRQPAHLDMNPVPSRNSASSAYRQNATLKAGDDGFTQNPYFENYSPADDSRNVIREFRAAVFEDKEDRGLAESKRILTRGFESQWVPKAVIEKKNLTTLNAYEELKPAFDNPATNYRKR